MNLKDLSEKIRGLADAVNSGIIKANKHRLQTIASNEMEAQMKFRIFLEGRTTDGAEIGHYSTKETYINPDKLSSLIAKGKLKKQGKFSKKPLFKNGNPRKTMYLKGGYKEFKDKVNFDSNVYNLTLTGTSKDSIKIGKKGDDIVLGFSSEARRKILQGHETRLKKKIFEPSKEELKAVAEVIEKELRILFNEFMSK